VRHLGLLSLAPLCRLSRRRAQATGMLRSARFEVTNAALIRPRGNACNLLGTLGDDFAFRSGAKSACEKGFAAVKFGEGPLDLFVGESFAGQRPGE
jgi:hypothetical protein